MTALDPRLNAYRPDLADARLRGLVAAERFVEGDIREVAAPTAPFRREPSPRSAQETEALFGERVRVFEERPDGWAWVQLETDGYVGWMLRTLLAPVAEPTHRVTAVRTFLYTGPDMKLPWPVAVSIGSRLRLAPETVETRGTAYRLFADGKGAVVAKHVAPIGARAGDPVMVAEKFLHAPYLWGGRSGFGVDCSGLVQLALAEAGIPAPRDTDLQEQALGDPVEGGVDGRLRRGDLVFWPGHVGIMADRQTFLHANAHAMAVTTEPVHVAVDRIRRSGSNVSSVRRLAAN